MIMTRIKWRCCLILMSRGALRFHFLLRVAIGRILVYYSNEKVIIFLVKDFVMLVMSYRVKMDSRAVNSLEILFSLASLNCLPR